MRLPTLRCCSPAKFDHECDYRGFLGRVPSDRSVETRLLQEMWSELAACYFAETSQSSSSSSEKN